MLQPFDGLTFYVGNGDTLKNMDKARALPPFSEKALDFLNTVSKVIFADTEAKSYPDVMTFAFWCRKAALCKMQAEYPNLSRRLGRGVAFHIAPSNVAVNFAYSFAAGLITGNANIVRLPSKDFSQMHIICGAVRAALSEHEGMAKYICLVQYEHQKSITDALSAMCQVRVIWGGNETIRTIRNSPIAARAFDITFADRVSICVIHADRYLEIGDKNEMAHHFYNDTFLTDQNACTSPKLVVWLGNNVSQAQAIFWGELEKAVRLLGYDLQPSGAVRKLTDFCRLAIKTGQVKKVSGSNIAVFRAQLEELTADTLEYAGNCGYFLEYAAESIEDILPVCGDKCQTISVLGLDKEDLDVLLSGDTPGIDRIIPVGQTMDFSLRWDGYDLVYVMTRIVDVLC